MELLKFIFSSPIIYFGAVILIAVVGDCISKIVVSFFSRKKETNNFYICEKNIDKEMLEEIKKEANKRS